jgi:hypothetical protein
VPLAVIITNEPSIANGRLCTSGVVDVLDDVWIEPGIWDGVLLKVHVEREVDIRAMEVRALAERKELGSRFLKRRG